MILLRSTLLTLTTCAATLALAQQSPTEAVSRTAKPQYESAFADYKPFREVELVDWRHASAAGPHARSNVAGEAVQPSGGSASGNSARDAAVTPPTAGNSNGVTTAPMTDHGKMNHKE